MAVETLGFIQPTSLDTGSGFSDTIWRDCPINGLKDGSVLGYFFEYDFDGFKLASNVNAAEAYWSDGFNVFGDNGGAVAALAVQGGGITISSDGDNEGVVVRQTMPSIQIQRAKKKFWWEARIRTSTITDTKHGFFCGFMDTTAVTAIVPITAAGALADVNLYGFHRDEADGDQLDLVYKADGVTRVQVATDIVSTSNSVAGALAVDTFIKVGGKYSPDVDPFNLGAVGDTFGKYLLNSYVNGVMGGTPKQIPSADGTDFPNDVLLGFVFCVLNATGTTPGTSSIDRVRIAQVY